MAKQENTFEKAQDIINDRQYRIISIAALLILTVGTVFYHFVEKLTWVDAFYFSSITLATVGYGDITPQTTLGKIFTVFYILFGIGIIVTFTSNLIKRAQERRERKHKK